MFHGEEAAVTMSGSKALSLVPFGYFAVTRVTSLRDLAYLVTTSWLPAIWLLFRLAGLDMTQSVLTFVIGYMAFISIYELGYLVNDAWDARRSGEGRPRTGFYLGPAYILAFVIFRIGLWIAIGALTGWINSLPWLAGFAVLAVAIAQHNLVSPKEFRLASFYELAVLRFTLPILAAMPAAALAPVLIVALIPYSFPRFLAYMESKDILRLEKRREARFGLLLQLSFLPLMLLFAYLLDRPVLVELQLYFVAIHGLWWALSASRIPITVR